MSETDVTTESQEVDTDNLDAFADNFFGQKEAAPTKTKVEAEQEEAAEETQETEAQTDEEDEAKLEKPVDDRSKKRTVQDRIDEVVRQREELRRESQAELQKLRDEVETLKKGVQPVVETQKAQEPQHDAVDKDGNPIYALGEFDPQYIRDLTRYTLNEERERMQTEIAETQKQKQINDEQQALASQWNEKVQAVTTEYPDFIEKGQTLLNGFSNLEPNYAQYLSNILMEMDKGPDVLYYLSNHPDEAVSIVNSGARKATLALGRIEAKFLEADAQKTLAKPKVSKAPPPPAERARGTNGAFISVAGDTEDLDQFSQEFFKKK